MPTGAEGLGDPRPELVYADRDLLRAGAGGAHDPDRAAPHDVGEPEGNTVDDRGPAVGPHYHQVVVPRVRLQRKLVGYAHIVAEQHDVHTEAQSLHPLGRGVVAWY